MLANFGKNFVVSSTFAFRYILCVFSPSTEETVVVYPLQSLDRKANRQGASSAWRDNEKPARIMSR